MALYHVVVTVPGLAMCNARRVGPGDRVLDVLTRDHGSLEPAMRETTAGAQIILSTEAADEASAAAKMTAVLVGALDAAGVGHLRHSARRADVSYGGPPPF